MEHTRREVVWSVTAQQDLIDIWGYFARVASSATADRLVDEIEAAANRLVIDPRMHRVRRDLSPNLPGELRSVSAHPYTLFYRMNPQSAHGREEIEILRVLHERRDFSSELPNTG
jgi:plasmid stabilization system protein ParE